MLNIIAGDGHTNVLNLNSLDFERWEETTKDEDLQETYFDGWRRMKKLRAHKNSDKDFMFDLVMANPPFAGDIKESRIIHRYYLAMIFKFLKDYVVVIEQYLHEQKYKQV